MNCSGLSVSASVYDFLIYASWCLYLLIYSATFATRKRVKSGSSPKRYWSLVQWMNALTLFFCLGFNRIWSFTSVRVEYDFKSSSNYLTILSMHDMKLSSNNSLEIRFSCESPWKSVGILIPHMNTTFATVNGGFAPGLAGCCAVGGFSPCSCISCHFTRFVS